jgi:hypothetical protein
MPATTGDPALAGSSPVAVEVPPQSTRGPVAAARRTLLASTIAAATPLDMSTVARDPAAVQTAGNPAGGSGGIAVANVAPRETFAALDGGSVVATPTLMHASSRQAEAGFKDPELGWVGVRADLSGGGVHATVLPSSSQAAQELGRHMDGLSTYLTEQHTPVASLAMDTPSGRAFASTADGGHGQGTEQGMQQGTGQGAQQGADQQTGQQAYPEPEASAPPRGLGFNAPDPAQTSVEPVEDRGPVQGAGGRHISVVA